MEQLTNALEKNTNTEENNAKAPPTSGYKMRYRTCAEREALAESSATVLGCGDHLIPVLDMLAELDPIHRDSVLRAALAINDGEILRKFKF